MAGHRIAELRAAKRELASRYLQGGTDAPRVAPFALTAARASAGSQVHAVGLGFKRVAGRSTTTRCVRFHVLQKLANSLVPAQAQIPSSIDGIPTEVVVSPQAFLLAGSACGDPRQQQRPLRPGVGISGPRTTVGTLGCLVRDRGPAPRTYLLTCSHVLADEESALGEVVLQPALADGGTPAADAIAKLVDFTEILSAELVDVDAAIAAISPTVAFDPVICGMVRPEAARAPQLNVGVRVRGRSGGNPREGFVTDVDLDVRVALPSSPQTILYNDQTRIEPFPGGGPFSVGGDSGSVVLERGAPVAVGLIIGGDPGGSYSLSTPIRRVLDRLNVALY